jgi:hypothetical protein
MAAPMDFSRQITKAIVLLGACGAAEQAMALLRDVVTHADIDSCPAAKIDALRFLAEIAAQSGHVRQAMDYLKQAERADWDTHPDCATVRQRLSLQLLKKRLARLQATVSSGASCHTATCAAAMA